MKQHQVLTGSANPGSHCYGVGRIQNFTFWAYGSGCDLVISSSARQPVQIISSDSKAHITALDCSESSGNIAVAYSGQVVIFTPKQDNSDYKWIRSSSFNLNDNHGTARILSWNYASDQLLIGCEVINLWTLKESTDSGRVSFQVREHETLSATKWQCAWSSDLDERPIQLAFSPNTAPCPLFASVAKGECMIKIWYSRQQKNAAWVNANRPDTHDQDAFDFTFTYLMHPQPVIGFEWRKNFVYNESECFSNTLISSCEDQICRVWCETKLPVSRLLRFQSTVQSSLHRKRRKSNQESEHAKRAASAPVMSNLDSAFWNPLHKSCLHQDIRHFHIAASINPLSDIPLLPAFSLPNQVRNCSDECMSSVFTVHWLNNKFHQAQLLVKKGGDKQVDHSQSTVDLDSSDELMETADQLNKSQAPRHFHGMFNQLTQMWRDSRDALYSIHPTDGSLLVWHIDWLDEDRAGKISQPQICFSSRIPLAFSSGDAGTLCPRMIMFVNYTTQQNILHSTSYMSFQSQLKQEENLGQTIYSSVQILSKHNDGSLNLWQISFNDEDDFSSISSISHSSRFCGHCFHLSGILSHPLLPLMVTTAGHQPEDQKNRESELILWRVDPIGPLSHTGGLSELARVSCQQKHLFSNVTWFPILLPSWCLGIENNSPSTALVSLSENKLQVYQIVVDAGKILADVLSPMSTPADSGILQNSLVSQQSSAHPGCLLHLTTVEDEGKKWGEILFLETFPANVMEANTSETNTSSKFVKSFYIVMLEVSEGGAYLHTWSIVFSGNMSSMKGARLRRTTVQMLDTTSEEDSSEDEDTDRSQTFPNVGIQVTKMSNQRLVFPVDCSVVSACSWAGRFTLLFASEQEEHLYPAPYHLCTACSDGSIYFWSCSMPKDKGGQCVWNLRQNSCDQTMSDTDIDLHGNPIMIKAANPTLLACLCVVNSNKVIVSVYECASSGGAVWKEQGLIEYTSVNLNTLKSQPSFHLDWLSQEDGSFFLVVGVSTNIQIYALTPTDLKDKQNTSCILSHDDGISPTKRLVKQQSLDMHTRHKLAASKLLSYQNLSFGDSLSTNETGMMKLLEWTKLTELDIAAPSYGCDLNKLNRHITVSWARDGMLVVASATEMHVFSQWLQEDKTKYNSTKEVKLLYKTIDDEVVVGLSELVDKVCPSLPQYHPHVLSELLNSSHLDVVRSILIHLAICMNGDYCESTCKPEIMQVEKFQFSEQLSSLMQTCSSGFHITPLPLHDLLGPDGMIRKKTTNDQDSQAKDNQGISSSENALGDFFMETEKEEGVDINDELDEILGMQSQKSKSTKYAEKVDLSKLDHDYFGKEHCRVIHEFLIHNQLPGLTSFDQMELMALADTLEMTNASNLKQQTQEDYTETQPSAVGLTAGERGYAVSGGGAGALDSCGLRFVMALHNHLCLLNSLPAPNRALLLKRGLNTCQFAWAFHSEAEEEILSLLPSVQKGAPDWQELHSMGAGWWIRSTVLLRRLIEQTARAAFLKNNEPLNAALFYLALNKKSVLCGLFRSVKDQRMLQFFQNNFKEDRWRRAALKNAFALMGKQRFQEAAAFFLLAGSVKDAVEICIDKMKDIQLALVICRLRENADISHHQLLTAHVLDEDGSKREVKRIPSDCFLRSMAYWILGQYDKSISTLLTDIKFEDITDVFNFYVFLRSHPIVLRNRAQMSGQAVSSLTSSHHVCGPLDVVDEKERKLIFQTAVVHLESGCPILAIDSLTKLPKVFMSSESNANQIVKKIEEQTPVLPKVVEDPVDWSQPVVQEEDELELDWSEEESGSESDGDAVPVVTTIPQITVEADAPATIAEEEKDTRFATKHDVFAHHLRMNACFKIFVQELKAIATAYSSDGGLLRSKLYIWLEDASNIFHRVFGLNEFDVEDSLKPKPEVPVEEDCSTDNEDSTSMGSITATASTPAPSLHELLLADNQDWKTRRLGLLRRRKWLQRHHNFLRTLLSYCNLHDSAFGALANMRMELLLLLQESLQDRNSIFSLSSPLPHPSENIPLITSVVAMCKTVVADPLTHLSHMTKDILCSVLYLASPPHPNTTDGHQNSVILCSQAAALSSCIYQSLCDTSTPSYHSQLLKTDGLQVEFSGNESYRRPSTPNLSTSYLQQMGAPLHPSSYVAPTTAPTQWPGVAVLQSMLNSEASGGESKNKIVTLLCEATASVYISLLVHALQTHNTALMYRLANHKLGSKMWNAVFGGGVKLYMKYSKSRLNVESGSLTSGNKWRERLTHKLLSNSERKNSVSSSSEQSTYREKFVPPETSLWEWLLTKPFMTPSNDEGLGFDSDVESEDSASSVTSFGSDNDFDDDSFNAATEEVSQQDDDHSYSWKLMRAGVVQTVLSNIQSFIPLAGFELTELSSSSPLLCASIQLLQQWHSELMAKVDDCGGPPSGFLPSLRNANYVAATSGSPAQRPAMLRYQVMLEPNNTPFEGSGKDCMGCRRLWHSLVKKENLQEMFIKYIFHRKSGEAAAAETGSLAQEFDDNASVVTAKSVGEFGGKVKILHKETDLLAAFCINNVNSNCIALASAKDIQELDLSVLLAADNWAWVDDIATQTSNPSSFPNDEDFLFVSVPNKTPKVPQIFLPGSHSSVPWSSTSQTGQGANVLMKRQVGGVRRMESHPTLPYYLTGNRDGAICMWEWGHQQMISQYQAAGHYAKVNNLHFSNLGNKISAVGADGYLSMWQVSSGLKPFLHHLCHDRGVNDCCFISSASVLATAGLSSNNKNVAIWDTLMPKKSILVKDFATHEQTGAYCIRYLPRHRTLLVGGKNGQITVFDDRCLQGPVTKFAAHETSVKCLAVDSSEKFYVTGSANGSVKVWDALSHKMLYVSNQEHSRSSIFRNFGSGTVQIVTTKDHILTCGADGSLKMKMLPSSDYWML